MGVCKGKVCVCMRLGVRICMYVHAYGKCLLMCMGWVWGGV